MSLIKNILGTIVLSSAFVFPNYADAQRSRRVSPNQYYCNQCGSYHTYVTRDNRSGGLSGAISDSIISDVLNAATQNMFPNSNKRPDVPLVPRSDAKYGPNFIDARGTAPSSPVAPSAPKK